MKTKQQKIGYLIGLSIGIFICIWNINIFFMLGDDMVWNIYARIIFASLFLLQIINILKNMERKL